MEDKDLEKVTKMLERGGTMLAKHCECGAPLFKYQGKVVCPVCDAKKQEQARLAVPVETRPAVSHQAVEKVNSTPVMEMPERRMSVVVGSEELNDAAVEAAVIAKINDIAARLASETYPNKIQMYLDILERSLRVLKELHGISR
ncbi:MAG TPA: Sjogren's syndrome/scleroderma autoantigen 1 family protein [Methanocella sp.]|uniref:Sjogren's syndrome/scleroderma autoantigen 1 family protein n=1 Tax=Methanocella sp. TaxID=2052833 RepID=UPI002D00D10B|nr:Sjogren's syndrome/scleroderma autoantigen 1 family protein [Methanocella sp.]HTY91060.1 Sjogren's syndrome/scleroderma autoantigen 1 family protein [Methanocella sp.]